MRARRFEKKAVFRSFELSFCSFADPLPRRASSLAGEDGAGDPANVISDIIMYYIQQEKKYMSEISSNFLYEAIDSDIASGKVEEGVKLESGFCFDIIRAMKVEK